MVRIVRDTNYIYRSESPADVSKPYYRSKRYTQAQCAREINGRPRGKFITGNPLATKKVWEPLDSQRKWVRSNSDSDVTLKSTPRVEASESDQLLECCSSCSDEVTDNSVQTSHKDNDSITLSMSRANHSGDIGNCFVNKEKPHHYSKEAVAEDGELCSAAKSVETLGSSMSTSSNSDNCSSCLSEGDINTYSNNQNLESTSTSDSEESSQNSEGRETSGITASHSVVDDQHKLRGLNATNEASAYAGKKPGSFLRESAPHFESRKENLGISSQPQSVLPQMHNQSMKYPVFQAPTVGYYHQRPVSWPGPTNGLISYPHTNHYFFLYTFGCGFNGDARLMQYGTLQNLASPLPNYAHVPVFQSVAQVNGINTKDPTKAAYPTALKQVQHSTKKAPAANQHPEEVPEVVDAKQNKKSHKMVMRNDGFSLFHFGIPVALSTGLGSDQVTLGEGMMRGTSLNFEDGDLSCDKDSVEEYNLFAANNGIKFSIF